MNNATIGDLLHNASQQLEAAEIFCGHGTDNVWDEAVYLLCYALQLPVDVDRSVLEQTPSVQQQQHFEQLVAKRIAERIPAPYLTGEAWFCGLPFNVDKRVIIPRSPIGQLIAEGFSPWLAEPPSTLLDLCCGSGCIGIASAMAFDSAQVVLSDLSSDALAVAQSNIERHQLAERVSLSQGDLFAGLQAQQFDLILCNPPYVDASDFAAMPAEFGHEPVMALVSGDDGLDFTRRLLREAPNYLTERGLLICEVGNSSVALDAAFPNLPLTWLEFAEGDGGVFVVDRQQLLEQRDLLA
ncbi:MAG: 50S ribosomal protein L3 N(5)-glutamine methyltransferase [Porticoccaceae bacterium]